MKIRDQLAVQILAAFLSNSWLQKEFNKDLTKLGIQDRVTALRRFQVDSAYQWADEMIEARKRKPEPGVFLAKARTWSASCESAKKSFGGPSKPKKHGKK